MLPEDTIWSYFLQIVLALHQCHHPGVKVHTGTTPASPDMHDAVTKQRSQVLHRDIKPENVFLNGEGIVKMGDFGLSKQLASASFANTYVGTPYYMSPEVMQEKAYDSKSDIWSLGCLLYELCALNPPFHEAKTHTELSHFIRSGRIPPLPRVYSSSLTQVIKAMLNVNPAMRPSAQQLLQHERLDLAFKLANMEKMVRHVKAMKVQLSQKEADVSSRERELEAHATAFRAFLAQKETEVRAAMEARERELTEAMMARERELCAGVLRREEELRARWEEREEEIRVAWDARELEMVAREEAVRKEEERLEALRVELESAKGKKEQSTKNPIAMLRQQLAPKTPISRFAAKSAAVLSPAPGSAMKGVVLTSTGEALPTPQAQKAPDHHDVPAAKDLAKLLQASPVVGLDFGRFADDDHDDHDDDERPHSPCPAERERPPQRARKMSTATTRSSLPVLVAPPAPSLTNVTNAPPPEKSSEKPPVVATKPERRATAPVDKKLSKLLAAAAPVYNLEDEENLPSPFIKRSVPTANANPVATRAAPARPTLVKRPSAVGTGTLGKARPSIARAKAASEEARKTLARAGTQ